LSEGEFLNSQPENTVCQAKGSLIWLRSSTKTWTKAPVSGGCSQGRVFSQVASLTTTLPIRRDSPGFITRSWVSLLRLLRKPSVATRSLTGVPYWLSTIPEAAPPAAAVRGPSLDCASGAGAP
jgi:hypothetical protein